MRIAFGFWMIGVVDPDGTISSVLAAAKRARCSAADIPVTNGFWESREISDPFAAGATEVR